jgi:hypothetical protein
MLISGSACCLLVQKYLSENMKFKYTKLLFLSIIFSGALYGNKAWSLTLWKKINTELICRDNIWYEEGCWRN